VPVRIHIDQVPNGVRLAAGMTATVQIDSDAGACKLKCAIESRRATRRDSTDSRPGEWMRYIAAASFIFPGELAKSRVALGML
jgi:hypothetical protein